MDRRSTMGDTHETWKHNINSDRGQLSQWAELAEVRQATAEAFLKEFRERITARIGAPKTLILDNDVQFTGKKTKTAI